MSKPGTRGKPNILITGTPGCGKTSVATDVAAKLGFKHFNPFLGSNEGGVVVEYHACELFPERWFDGVFVLRCSNTILFDRLTARGYSEQKIKENVECEIFGTIVEEAKESYKEEIVKEVQNDFKEQLEENVNLIVNWAKTLIKNK
ncbi:hypothetical protein FO519_003226 [Halicephalobus sp. NKZ332]|nr:hypothetical protein FO519_003226 [Halicephalobus sp. NKZ332]